MRHVLFTILLFLFFQATHAQDVERKIKDLNAELVRLFNKNDMAGVAAYYLDSALISGGRTNITGRKNIDSYWAGLKDKKGVWRLEVDKVENYRDIVIQRGRSYLNYTGGDGVRRDSNVRFVLIWKKTGDSYKILYDIYSSL
jgi:ketosteroid isomerase-like protein